jgi:hypothetical protein
VKSHTSTVFKILSLFSLYIEEKCSKRGYKKDGNEKKIDPFMIFLFVSKIYRWQDKNQEKEKLKLLYLTPLVPKPAARGAKLLLL